MLGAICTIPEGNIAGDFDSSGMVDFQDFLTLSANFGQISRPYEEGDANCNNIVGFEDFLTLSDNFGRTSSALAAVPEPSTISLAMCCIATLLIRRRW